MPQGARPCTGAPPLPAFGLVSSGVGTQFRRNELKRKHPVMAITQTGKKVAARDRARAAIAAGLANELAEQERIERERRAQQEREAKAREAALTKFFEADERRNTLLSELEELDQERGNIIVSLDNLGIKNDKIALMVDLTESEIRRIRKTVGIGKRPTARQSSVERQDTAKPDPGENPSTD